MEEVVSRLPPVDPRRSGRHAGKTYAGRKRRAWEGRRGEEIVGYEERCGGEKKDKSEVRGKYGGKSRRVLKQGRSLG